MPAAVQIKKKKSYSKPKLSRESQTKILKEKLEPEQSDKQESSGNEETAAPDKRSKNTEPTKQTETLPSLSSKKIRGGVIVEQVLTYSPGKNKPVVELKIKLTTALRGKRKRDGLSESAYLLRMEVLGASEGTKVEGFQLGPWNGEKLNLDKGGIIVCEPVWTGFQPFTGSVKGRIILHDTQRHRLIDLPWSTEGTTPGAEPYTA